MNDDVTHLPQSRLRQPPRWSRRAGARRSRARRLIRGALLAKTALVCLVLVAGLALYLRIGIAPLRFEGLTAQVTAALESRLGEAWRISLDDSAITLVGGALAMKVAGLDILDADGALVARAPRALVSISAWSLAAGRPLPRAIELHDVQLRLQVSRDGSLSLAPPDERPLVPPAQESVAVIEAAANPEPLPFTAPATLALAIGALLEDLLDPGNPVGAIDYARVVDASLTLVDEDGRERVGFSDVDAHFWTQPDARSLDAEFEGETGRWRLTGRASRDADGGYDAVIGIEGMPLDDVVMIAGLPRVAGSRSLRLSASAELGVDERSRLTRFDARLWTSAGEVSINNKDFSSLRIDRLSARASWDPQTDTLLLPSLDFQSQATRINLAGGASVDPETGRWRLDLAGANATLGGATERDRIVSLDRIGLRAQGGEEGVVVEELSLEGEDIDLALAFSFGAPDDLGGLRIALQAQDTGVRTALRVWPSFIAPEPRKFLLKAVPAGTLDSITLAATLTGEELRMMRARRGMSHEALAVEFAISDATLIVDDKLPPIERIRVRGYASGRSVSIGGETGEAVMRDGRSLALSEALFHIGDFWNRDEVAALDLRIAGPADALASFLATSALAPEAAARIEPDEISGRVALALSVPLPLAKMPPAEELGLVVAGKLEGLSIGALFGQEALTDGAFDVLYRGGELSVEGRALLSGDPAAITLRHSRGRSVEADVSLVLDDDGRTKRGLAFGDALRGPLAVRVRTGLAGEGARVDVDLAQAAIEDLVPGWRKPAGQPGSLSFVVKEGEERRLEEIALDAGPARARGAIRLAPSGEIAEARFDSLRISPGDDASVTATRSGSLWKVNVRGNLIDARPFLERLTSGQMRAGAGEAVDIDLDLRAEILAGHNEEALTNARLEASLRGEKVQKLQLSGRLPGAEVYARTGLMPNGDPVILLESDDAGSTLRFADLYTRMIGGALNFQIGTEGTRRPGILIIRDFLLRDEPALRRVVAQHSGATGRDGAPIDFAAARFTQARIDFVQETGRIDLEEAVMWGAEVGFKLEGFVDFGFDYVDIKGTFVPAYGLNNVFAQVPLFGAILGGNRNEGLIGVNFRVSGPASGPNLTINPLSAIAPGFLRQLFGARATPFQSPPPELPRLEPQPLSPTEPMSLAPPPR